MQIRLSGTKIWQARDMSTKLYEIKAISSAFVESTVNEVISRRMAKKQQMRWTKKGAHLLLQVRVKTLNDELRKFFCKWYPDMKPANEEQALLAVVA